MISGTDTFRKPSKLGIVIIRSKTHQCNRLKTFFTCLMLLAPSILAQEFAISQYQYVSPVPDSKMILPQTNIIIREGNTIDKATLFNNSLTVIGSVSGMHQGSLVLSDDQKTILFKPFNVFIRGETVYVHYDEGISKFNGDELPPFNFKFKISERDPNKLYSRSVKEILECGNGNYSNYAGIKPLSKVKKNNDGLPEDFPQITINVSNNPSAGYIFISPLLWSYPLGYLIIVDNDGVPIFYQKTPYSIYDFKRQDNGLLTFGDVIAHYFYAMDSSYTIIDSFATGSGYNIDNHDFLPPNLQMMSPVCLFIFVISSMFLQEIKRFPSLSCSIAFP